MCRYLADKFVTKIFKLQAYFEECLEENKLAKFSKLLLYRVLNILYKMFDFPSNGFIILIYKIKNEFIYNFYIPFLKKIKRFNKFCEKRIYYIKNNKERFSEGFSSLFHLDFFMSNFVNALLSKYPVYYKFFTKNKVFLFNSTFINFLVSKIADKYAPIVLKKYYGNKNPDLENLKVLKKEYNKFSPYPEGKNEKNYVDFFIYLYEEIKDVDISSFLEERKKNFWRYFKREFKNNPYGKVSGRIIYKEIEKLNDDEYYKLFVNIFAYQTASNITGLQEKLVEKFTEDLIKDLKNGGD